MNEFIYSPVTERTPVPHVFRTSAWRFPSAPRQFAGASVVMLWLLIFLLSWVPQTMGQEGGPNGDNLVELSIEKLLKAGSTAVFKKAELQKKAPAPIHVLREERNHTSRTSTPDLLRRIPGLGVARIDTGQSPIATSENAASYTNKPPMPIDG